MKIITVDLSASYCQYLVVKQTSGVDHKMVGKKYNKLFVLRSLMKGRYECLCDCGNIVNRGAGNVIAGNTKSCGCAGKVFKATEQLIGQVFGHWTVVGPSKVFGSRSHIRCRCVCNHMSWIDLGALKKGESKSCGCQAYMIADEDRKPIKQRHRNIEWFRAVYLRCNHVCQKCGNDSFLEAHHINSVSKYPEQEDIVDNGILLCNKCHTSFHVRYSYHDATKEDLDKFLANN
jgi:hypothetical protein